MTPTEPPLHEITVPPGTWERVVSLPWVIQLLAVLFIIFIAAQAAPRILGPWQSAIESWTNGRRRTRTAGREADVSALALQVDNMQTVLAETRQELAWSREELAQFRAETRRYQDAHEVVLSDHGQWDVAMIALVVDLGGNPPPKPSLWPSSVLRVTDTPAGDGDVSDTTHP